MTDSFQGECWVELKAHTALKSEGALRVALVMP